MIKYELIFSELKKGTEYGCRLLVNEFFEDSQRTISSLYGIRKSDTGAIVNKAMLKIIDKMDLFEFKSDTQFENLVKKIVCNTALDFLREKRNQKRRLQEEDIQFVTSTPFSSANLKADSDNSIFEDENVNINNEENEVEGADEDLDNDIDISKSRSEIDFLHDQEMIKEDERIYIVEDILNSFTKDEQCYLRLHLMGITHKELSEMRDSTPDATRKYINRLLKKFFKCVSEKLNKNYTELYENYKKQNIRFNTEESIKRREY